ncbi:putative bifunctional diguanylate cyclase/phosphodiesterase [Rhabdothermincola sediminis]|uniref:putative bifunctional diguanylate cyclase/phosphodiesterase n=1 Tax=Rhabdothermincola sediminis TaxID=2751370 RepID=UPI001AA0A3EA|nr:EAL domain-containing protein [Rhabdothermincola sediminis]
MRRRMGGAASEEGWSSDTAFFEARDRQIELWRMVIRARYAAVAAAALLATTPAAGPKHWWLAAIAIFLVIPYNAVYDVLLRRRGVLPNTVAYTDQVVAVGIIAFAPELTVPLLVVMLAVAATSAVAFGRRVAAQAALVGAIGTGVVMTIAQPEDAVPVYLIYLVAGAFIIIVVGSVSEVERRVRHRYAELMGGIDAVVWEQVSRNPSRLYVNRRAEEIFGYPVSDWRRPGFWGRTVHPDDRFEAAKAYREAIRKGQNRELEYRMIAADGRVVHVHDRMRVETDGEGRAVHVRGVLLDVTDRKEAQEQVDQLMNLVERIRLALFVFRLADPDDDESLTLIAVNPEASMITGVHPTASVGRRFREVIRLPDADVLMDNLLDVIRLDEGWMVDDFKLGTSKKVYAAHAFPLPGHAVGLTLQDVTERAMAAEVLRRQALHDGLTGLPNRTLLNDRLRQALQHAEVSGEPVALLMMDLDQFKEVNDALGHDHGDRLLIEMSRRLQGVLRDVDTIARLGGDEFAVLMTFGASEQGAVDVAQRIREALERPFRLGGISVQTSASIGIALAPAHGTDAETLAQRADVAMYTAKRGGGGIAMYAPEHDQSSIRRLALLGELRRAIDDDELVLHYQPVVDLCTGEVRSAEALVRWQHPEFGLMPPGEFIELAEVSGTIHALTRWVLEHAVRQAQSWAGAGLELSVAVNLSVRNLYDPDLVPWLSDLLTASGLAADRLQLEITESELMDDPLLAMEVLGRIKALGSTTSIDDFGTGYSSLAYLKNLPIDQLKIDRSFVGTMARDESDLTIVRSTIDLSHNLGLMVVAEGVEDRTALRMLADLGCDRAQGYVVSRPIPADELERWLRDPAARRDLQAQLRSSLVPDDLPPSGVKR